MEIQKVKELVLQYQTAGIVNSWNYNFIKSISEKGNVYGRGVQILEDILNKGNPSNWPQFHMITQIDQAIVDSKIEENVKILKEFRQKIIDGRELSQKQVEFANSLINSSKIEIEFIDCEEISDFLEVVKSEYRHSSPYYIANKRSTFQRVENVLNRYQKLKKITKNDFEFLQSTFKKRFLHIQEVKKMIGDLAVFNKDANYFEGDESYSTKNFVKGDVGMIIGVKAPCLFKGVFLNILFNQKIVYMEYEYFSSVTKVKKNRKNSCKT